MILRLRHTAGLIGLLLAFWFPASATYASERINVVATFSILADFVSNVGGDRVAVSTLVKRGGDTHVFKPTPSDANAISRADLVVENGVGFEGWMGRLIKASGYRGPRLVATKGITPRALNATEADDHKPSKHDGHGHTHAHHDHGALDPHAWLTPANALIYVENIRDGLCAVDQAGCATYTDNAKRYTAALRALHDEIEQGFAHIPQDERRIVTPHDAFGYFGDAYGLTFLAPLGMSTDSDASAKDVARLIRLVRKNQIRGIFLENVTDPRLTQQIARETGLTMGGTLYPGSLSKPGGPADSYLKLMRHNAETIADGIRKSKVN